MSQSTTDTTLDDCGCCAGLGQQTPSDIFNRPGLSSIASRVGTYSQFREAMIAALSSEDRPMLRRLGTRQADDFSIALIDGWATVLDVLTFYQERLANEAYLRTAQERGSVRELARLIGFQLRPGVAASADLAFTLDTQDKLLNSVTLPSGLKVQSVPGPNEKPQTFEIATATEARPQWNAMRPRLKKRHPLAQDDGRLLKQYLFEGVATGLKLGDIVVLTGNKDSLACTVTSLEPKPELKWTQVTLLPLGQGTLVDKFPAGPRTAPRSTPATNSFNSPVNSKEFLRHPNAERVMVEVFTNVWASQEAPPSVMTFRARAAIFGHNAPLYASLPSWQKPDGVVPSGTPWNDTTLNKFPAAAPATTIYLDTTYSLIVPGSFVLLQEGSTWKMHEVDSIDEQSLNLFTISSKSTAVSLRGAPDLQVFRINKTTVHCQSTQLPLARVPIEDPVTGNRIELEGLIDKLYVGQLLIFCGELNDNRGNRACERVVIKDIEYDDDDEGFTIITLGESGLVNTYVRSTVTIYGNVVPATHGETVREVLGSGDAARAHQRFFLKQKPLTYTSGAQASGAVSSLSVRVNDVLWHEVRSFYGRGPSERIFITRHHEDAQVEVIFGDGIAGARVHTGVENITAEYRKGIGVEGAVKAGQLTLLMSRPRGLKEGVNPMPSSSGQDSQTLDDARAAAPVTVLTLERVVSLRDYEDYARAFAGVAKALATWTWNGQSRGVLVTVAGPKGADIPAVSSVYKALSDAVKKAGDPHVRFDLRNYEAKTFQVDGTVWISSDYQTDVVSAQIEAALRRSFSFEARQFGQAVALSEVMAVVQGIDGVLGVDIAHFYRSDRRQLFNDRVDVDLQQYPVTARSAGADLLTLHPIPVPLQVVHEL